METTDKIPVSDWQPTTNKLELAHIGKLIEEAGELTEAASIMMSIESHLPESRKAYTDEIADVRAMQELLGEHYGLDNLYDYENKPRLERGTMTDVPATMIGQIGKLIEILGRCIIQGVDEIDPSTKRVNRERLLSAMTNMNWCIDMAILSSDLDIQAIEARIEMKKRFKREWHEMIKRQAPA